MASMNWEPTIGLEIHAQLNTESKIFSHDSAHFGEGDNHAISPLSLGLPGSLPVLNQKVIDFAIRAGLAFRCQISKNSIFARKNYFYPDMPKGYQISQFERPICSGGKVSFFIEDEKMDIELERIHMEEDAGKSTHYGDYSLINLNRSGVPLLEIVSKPQIKTPQQAAEYSRSVRRTLRYLGICDGNLEEGSLRVDCNISIAPPKSQKLGIKVELKNINSFRFIEKAIEYEIQRQIDTLDSGGQIFQETRLYDSVKNTTTSMRLKEDSEDYRYFPDPDLLPCTITDDQINDFKKMQPELPVDKRIRYVKEFNLGHEEAQILAEELELAQYFESVCSSSGDPKMSANWVRGEMLAALKENQKKVSEIMPSEWLAQIITLIKDGTISGKIAKQVFRQSILSQKPPQKIVESEGLSQIQDSQLIEKTIDKIITDSPAQVDEYHGGKQKVFGYFVGQVMKTLKGRANPDQVNSILKQKLEKKN